MNHFDHSGHEGMDHGMPGMDHGDMDMGGKCSMNMLWCAQSTYMIGSAEY